jgi:D-aspartate ligase
MAIMVKAPESALVLGRGITALGVIRSLRRLGITACLVGSDDGFVCHSRFYRGLSPAAQTPTEANLTPFLRDLAGDPMVLIPCSDEWAAAVRALPADLAERFPSSLAPESALESLIDKGRFARTLASLAVPHPRTALAATEADLLAQPADLLAGAFLKPCQSQGFARRFGLKAFRFRDRDEALAGWRTAREAGFEMVLQEYIPGPPTAHYFIDGFVDRTGAIRARMARRRLRMDPPDFGNSTAMFSVPLEEVAAAVQSLDRLLTSIGYRGIFSAEFKHDARDGEFKILEVNTRAWWYVEFATDCGVNICGMAHRDARGLPVESVTRYRVGARCVYPYYDWGAWKHSPREVRPGLLTVVSFWVGATQPIFRWADPMPALMSAGHYLGERLGRRRA